MMTEKFMQFLKENQVGEDFESPGKLRKKVKTDLSVIQNAGKTIPKDRDSSIWLRENAAFLSAAAKKLKFQKRTIRKGMVSLFSEALFQGCEFKKTEEFIQFLESTSIMKAFSEEELLSLGQVYEIALISAISKAALEKNEMLPNLITAFHHKGEINFEQIRLHFSEIESILRKDPTGSYLKMTKETQNLYKNKILKLAKKKKADPADLAKRILEKAIAEGKHIGFYFIDQKKSKVYFPVLFLLFAFLVAFYLVFENRMI